MPSSGHQRHASTRTGGGARPRPGTASSAASGGQPDAHRLRGQRDGVGLVGRRHRELEVVPGLDRPDDARQGHLRESGRSVGREVRDPERGNAAAGQRAAPVGGDVVELREEHGVAGRGGVGARDGDRHLGGPGDGQPRGERVGGEGRRLAGQVDAGEPGQRSGGRARQRAEPGHRGDRRRRGPRWACDQLGVAAQREGLPVGGRGTGTQSGVGVGEDRPGPHRAVAAQRAGHLVGERRRRGGARRRGDAPQVLVEERRHVVAHGVGGAAAVVPAREPQRAHRPARAGDLARRGVGLVEPEQRVLLTLGQQRRRGDAVGDGDRRAGPQLVEQLPGRRSVDRGLLVLRADLRREAAAQAAGRAPDRAGPRSCARPAAARPPA